MQVELVSPEAVLFSGEATQVVARTLDGDIAFLNDHAPFIGALDISEVRVWTDGGVVSVAVNGGFVEVSNNVVTLLSDGAVLASEVDTTAAQAELDQAQAALRDDPDSEQAAAEKAWAEVRLRVAAGA
jgi:F-type H+-transporting ATPase subunit epsilon